MVRDADRGCNFLPDFGQESSLGTAPGAKGASVALQGTFEPRKWSKRADIREEVAPQVGMRYLR